MARTRLLKPEFFRSEDIAALSPLARLFFQGLWGIADRDGRLLDRPRRLALEILPYDNVDGEALLSEIARNPGLIVRYVSADGQICIQITNFEKHQKPHFKEPSLGLPAPDAANVGQNPDKPGLVAENPGGTVNVLPLPVSLPDPFSGSGNRSGESSPTGSGVPETPEAVFELLRSGGGKLTGRKLALLFAQVRVAEVPNSLPWSVPRNASDRDTQAAELEADPKALAEIVPTMRLVFAMAREGKVSKPDEILGDPSFAFGFWCSKLTKLREALRGISPRAPAAASADPDPYANVRRTGGRSAA